MGSIKNAFKFIFSPTASRTTGILVILIIAAAVPLTIFVAQKQQELRQRAAGLTYDQCVTDLISTTCADPENPDPACIQDASKNPSCQALLTQAPTPVVSAPTAAVTTPTKFKLTNQYVNPKDADRTPGSQTADCDVSTDCVGGYGGCFKQGFLSQIFICSAGNKWDSCNANSICKQVIVGSTTYYCTKDGPWSSLKPAECAAPTITVSPPTASCSGLYPPANSPNSQYDPKYSKYELQCLATSKEGCFAASTTAGTPWKCPNTNDRCFACPPTPTPPTVIPTPKPCSGAGYWCYGPADASNALASGCKLAPTNFDCKLSDGSNGPTWGTCYSGCPVSQTSTGGTYRNTTTGGGQPAAAPTYSPGSTSIPPGQLIALNFRGVTLPGISPDVGSADLKLTFFRGDNIASLQQIPGGPFTANIARSQEKNTFSGRVVFPASALQLPTSSLQVYFIQISVGSYQAKISGNDGAKARTIAEIQSQQLSGLIPINIFTDGKDSIIPAVKLLSGDINGDGFIDGADLGIIVACFGKKNVLTDSAGRTTDCSSKTQNRKFDADIDKNRSIDGIDINLWSRGANGII